MPQQWKNLEGAVRDAFRFRDSLFVITGPIYNVQQASLPRTDEPHKIPSAYFKVIYNRKGDSVSFIMDQSTERNTDYCSLKKTLSEIQSKISFDLPAFSDSQKIAIRIGC